MSINIDKIAIDTKFIKKSPKGIKLSKKELNDVSESKRMKNYKQLISESPFTKRTNLTQPKMSFKNGTERVFGLVAGRQTIIRIFKTDAGIPKGFLQWGTKEIRFEELQIRMTVEQLLKMNKSQVATIVNKAIKDKLI